MVLTDCRARCADRGVAVPVESKLDDLDENEGEAGEEGICSEEELAVRDRFGAVRDGMGVTGESGDERLVLNGAGLGMSIWAILTDA